MPARLVPDSFLRAADPRTRMALSLGASAAAVLPLHALAVFFAAYLALIAAARLGREVANALWRMRFLLALLFALDWLVAGLDFALLVTLRLALLGSSFTLLFATTTPEELCDALERLGVPHRFAFAFATACSSLDLTHAEWHGIVEAQQARGILGSAANERATPRGRRRVRLAALVALVVPAIVLATRRAWCLNEAAAVRGFGAPVRQRPRTERLRSLDYGLLGAALVVLLAALRIP